MDSNYEEADLGDDGMPLHSDDFYYGEIPKEVTQDQFCQIMVDGLIKYKQHHPTAFDEAHARAEFERERLEGRQCFGFTEDMFSPYYLMEDRLGRWIEHLSVRRTDHFPQWLQRYLEISSSYGETLFYKILDLAIQKVITT